jgi:hypothetical protein
MIRPFTDDVRECQTPRSVVDSLEDLTLPRRPPSTV